jgi:hypothetical protein
MLKYRFLGLLLRMVLQMLHYVGVAEDKVYGYFLLLRQGTGGNIACFLMIRRLEWDGLFFARYRVKGKAKNTYQMKSFLRKVELKNSSVVGI